MSKNLRRMAPKEEKYRKYAYIYSIDRSYIY
jgi:hypothetical protein